jgi:rubrerythrin
MIPEEFVRVEGDTRVEALRSARPSAREVAEELRNDLLRHATGEREVLSAYERFLEKAPDEHVRQLIGLVVDDERRHHCLLTEVVNLLTTNLGWIEATPEVPQLDYSADRAEFIATTKDLLDIERTDRRQFRRLRRRLASSQNDLSAVLMRLMELDTRKHIKVLEYLLETAAVAKSSTAVGSQQG